MAGATATVVATAAARVAVGVARPSRLRRIGRFSAGSRLRLQSPAPPPTRLGEARSRGHRFLCPSSYILCLTSMEADARIQFHGSLNVQIMGIELPSKLVDRLPWKSPTSKWSFFFHGNSDEMTDNIGGPLCRTTEQGEDALGLVDNPEKITVCQLLKSEVHGERLSTVLTPLLFSFRV